jgi:hypothetical protein
MAKSSPITETAIRSALVERLRADRTPGHVLIEELGIENGAARVDLAVAGGLLEGFEIKSDLDTLDRLARQMHAYHRVFDTVTLVTTASYLEQAEQLLPRWWGLWEARPREDGAIGIEVRRQPTPHAHQDPQSLAALLWRDEAYEFLVEKRGPIIKARAPRHAIYQALAMQLSVDQIRERVIDTLRIRPKLQARSVVAGC